MTRDGQRDSEKENIGEIEKYKMRKGLGINIPEFLHISRYFHKMVA